MHWSSVHGLLSLHNEFKTHGQSAFWGRTQIWAMHISFVQGSPSKQSSVLRQQLLSSRLWIHSPLTELHSSTVQGTPSSHSLSNLQQPTIAGFSHCPATHRSSVQLLKSLQISAWLAGVHSGGGPSLSCSTPLLSGVVFISSPTVVVSLSSEESPVLRRSFSGLSTSLGAFVSVES